MQNTINRLKLEPIYLFILVQLILLVWKLIRMIRIYMIISKIISIEIIIDIRNF